jgi:hypothetical protein
MASNPLLDSLRNIDPDAAVIYSDEVCAWVRCRLAIVGRVQLNKSDADASPEKLSSSIKQLTNHAYAVLDELPDDQLSFEDLWNLVLLISVPWTQTELEKRTKIVETLAEFATDISRSRKLILWSDVLPEEHFGSLGAGDKPWSPPSGDPLRETVKKFARNPDEDNALEALFKRRLSDEDIDDLIRVLGGKVK